MSSMRNRNRFRRANSGLPGYDNLGWDSFGHPASMAQPDADEYGFDSEFGEGVRKGPYRSGPAPASVGWSPDHPATRESLLEDYEETHDLYNANIKQAMERKASKCIVIAQSRLGKNASQQEIEDLALKYMDIPATSINQKFKRVASTFLAEDSLQEATGYTGVDVGPGNVMADEDLMAEDEVSAGHHMGGYMADEDLIAEDEVPAGHMGGYMEDEFDPMMEEDEFDPMMEEDEFDPMMEEDEFDPMMEEDEFDPMMEDEFESEMVSPIANLSEEIASLKKANMRLARQIRKFAEDSVQEATGYEGLDESVDFDSSLEDEGPAPRLASTKFASRMAELSEMAAAAETEGDDEMMAEILAEMNDLTAAYRRHSPYGESLHGFGYQDPDTRWKHRTQGRWKARGQSMPKGFRPDMNPYWDAETKRLHNQEYYAKNKHLWHEQRARKRQRRLLDRGLPMDYTGRLPRRPRGMFMADDMDMGFDGDMGYDEFEPMDEDMGYDEQEAFTDLLAEMEETAGQNADFVIKPKKVPGKNAEAEITSEEESMLAEMLAELETTEEPVASKKASVKSALNSRKAAAKRRAAEEEADEEEADEEHEGEDVMGLGKKAKIDPKLARIFAAAEEEADEEEADEEEADDEEPVASKKASKSRKAATKRRAAEEEADEDDETEIVAEFDDMADEEEPVASKKASKTRQASVKTLGNISREASASSSSELSKLWESAPDVSKYFS
jgi:hypothetical protein